MASTLSELVIGQPVFARIAVPTRWQNVVDRIRPAPRQRDSMFDLERSMAAAVRAFAAI
jgi:hypothetical protein